MGRRWKISLNGQSNSEESILSLESIDQTSDENKILSFFLGGGFHPRRSGGVGVGKLKKKSTIRRGYTTEHTYRISN